MSKNKERQSKTFMEIVNIQTDMNVSQEKWDKIFHNWENPEQCSGRKRSTGCTICDRLAKGEKITKDMIK